jgi:pyrrolidone-carboxylate peptidase
MEIGRNIIRRQSTFLFWEFIIIVLGVLSALAVDEWRAERELQEQRRHVLVSLLTDLKEDRDDYRHFTDNTGVRAGAAAYLDKLASGATADIPDQFQYAGEALAFLVLNARLQTTRSAIEEIGSTGGRAVITDDQLRIRILQYYALATDRSAVNQYVEPHQQRLQMALERLGVSYADGAAIDVAEVLADKTVHALIRSIGQTAEFAPVYVRRLADLNATLINDIERILLEG